MRVTLPVIGGPHAGQVFSFAGHDTFLVGRSKRAHFRLPAKDRYFSRVHFLVEVNPPQCRLMDMGSRNGTYVNGRRVGVEVSAEVEQPPEAEPLSAVPIPTPEAVPVPEALPVEEEAFAIPPFE